MQLISYAARTGTRRNLAALRIAGWRQMVCPGEKPWDGPYALDNGAWRIHRAGKTWTPVAIERWRRHVEAHGRGADFVVVPDIVCGGQASLDLTREHLAWVLGTGHYALVAVQDGFEWGDIAGLVCGRVGIFVGGSTEWKLATMASWADLAHVAGAICHVGRVNSAKRIDLVRAAGCDSFDGSSASRYAETLPLLDQERRQLALPFECRPLAPLGSIPAGPWIGPVTHPPIGEPRRRRL